MSILPILSQLNAGSAALRTIDQLAAGVSSTFSDLLQRSIRITGTDDGMEGVQSDLSDLQTPAAGARQMEVLSQELDSALERFAELATDRLRQAGIPVSEAIELKSDGRGGVLATGFHPQRAEIEQLFRNHPRLLDAFYDVRGSFNSLYALQAREAPTAREGEFHVRLLDATAQPLLV